MIGPSGVSGGEVAEDHIRAVKRKVLEDLNIGTFCDDVYQADRKRYHQDEQTAGDFFQSEQVVTEPTSSLFSPMLVQEIVEEAPVARLEVLVVDGTTCTWTTAVNPHADLNELTRYVSSSSSSTSSSEQLVGEQTFQPVQLQSLDVLDGGCLNYQQATTSSGYWRPVEASVVTTSPSNPPCVTKNTHVASPTHNAMQNQQPVEDQENGNLSWLLDFKLDPFIESADDRCATNETDFLKDNHYGSKNKSHVNGRLSGSSNTTNDVRRTYTNNFDATSTLCQDNNQSSHCGSSENRNGASTRCNAPKKPPFTYTELIEHALQEKGELTVSAIYQWISEHFPYYKSNDDRWKNSVRHNLSINPHFRKGSKAPHGAGHLWAIANRSDPRSKQIGTVSITNPNGRQVTKMETNNGHNFFRNDSNISQMSAVDEVEAATASIMQPSTDEEVNHIVNSVTLEHCAEQILSGVKREVEVQYLVPMVMASNSETNANETDQHATQIEVHCPVKDTGDRTFCGNVDVGMQFCSRTGIKSNDFSYADFLNPVSKEVVAEECGLIGEGYLVTDLNPTTLGLNMVDPELITPENLFGEELSFQFYELTSPSQLQSA